MSWLDFGSYTIQVSRMELFVCYFKDLRKLTNDRNAREIFFFLLIVDKSINRTEEKHLITYGNSKWLDASTFWTKKFKVYWWKLIQVLLILQLHAIWRLSWGFVMAWLIHLMLVISNILAKSINMRKTSISMMMAPNWKFDFLCIFWLIFY